MISLPDARPARSLRLYAQLARAGFMSYLAHPLTVLLILAIFVLNAAVFSSLWQAVLAGRPSAYPLGVTQMVTYVTVAWAMRSLTNNALDREIGGDIRKGTIINDMSHPVDLVLSRVTIIVGRAAIRGLTTTLPYLVAMACLFSLAPPASAAHAALTVLAGLASLLIICGINVIVGTTAFATQHFTGLCTVKGFLINTLSGLYIPYALMPGGAQRLLTWLPFRSLADLPAQLYLGTVSAPQGLIQVAVQWAWAIVLLAAARRYWEWMSRRHPVDGG
jgi:ABC-2 type transport system permease protein